MFIHGHISIKRHMRRTYADADADAEAHSDTHRIYYVKVAMTFLHASSSAFVPFWKRMHTQYWKNLRLDSIYSPE